MRHNIKKIIAIFICLLVISSVFSITASADIGPKASVRISFENMGDALCYGTLLSEKPSTGPSSVWSGKEEEAYHNENEYYKDVLLDYKTWKAFVDYEDVDGYYFLQYSSWRVSETKEINWNYYPPQKFKILLYYPETEKFVVSGIYERYAFDTYYTVDMDRVDVESNDYRLNAYRSYQYKQEILSLVARIIVTVAIEMGIALLFGFREKKALLLLVGVNTATQIILNVLLNIINFHSGSWAFVSGYIMLELAVFAIEAAIYTLLMNKITCRTKPVWFYGLYALVANAVSFGAGLAISKILPGIF